MLPGYERVFRDLASAYLIMGPPRQALDALDGYLSFTGGGAGPELVTQYLRGVAHHELGQTEDAIAYLEEFVSHDPTDYQAPAHRRLSELYDGMGQEDKADEHTARYNELSQ